MFNTFSEIIAVVMLVSLLIGGLGACCPNERIASAMMTICRKVTDGAFISWVACAVVNIAVEVVTR